jgi:Protein of unknown function (DUF3150)
MATSKGSANVTEVLDKCSLVFFRVQMLSPERDLGLTEKKDDVYRKVELVSTFDRALLAPFLKQKQRGNRLCVGYGTRVETLSAWLVNNDRLETLIEELKAIHSEVATDALELAQKMPAHVKQFAARHPKYTSQILDLAPSSKEIVDSVKCVYGAYRLRTEDLIDNSGCVAQDLQSLHGQALHEFAQTLRDSKISPATGTYTQATKQLLLRIAAKARSLDFLSPILKQVADSLEQAIGSLVQEGRFVGVQALTMASLIDQLLQPHKLIANNGFMQMKADTSPASVVKSPAQKPPRSAAAW